MKSITGKDMAKCVAKTGGMAILHRFMSLEEQLDIVNEFVLMTEVGTPDYQLHIGVSVGVKPIDYQNTKALYQLGARIFCVDVAHGDSKLCVDMTKYIATKYPDVFLIAGNVATADGAKRLWEAGADCVKVNIGAGSICTTRIEAGVGVPQLTALSDVADMKQQLCAPRDWKSFDDKTTIIGKPIFVIADGGCSKAGDLVKSLCFADLVMSGNLFSGSQETPTEVFTIDGKQYKRYDGSSTHKTTHIEGVLAKVATKGSAANIVDKLCQGIRSGCSYQGVDNLIDLKKDPQFVRITNAGLVESNSHNVFVIE